METTREPGVIKVGFRVSRLPRKMKVTSVVGRDTLLEHYERGECFLVADENDAVHGYLDASADQWKRLAWINSLTVAPEHRRAGIGKALLRAMLDWARAHNLERVIVETQTKNYPASSLFQKQGFAFCGFNDQYYSNRDIAIFFALSLH